MPVLFFFAYFVLETLAFYGVAKLLGVGWALTALFVTMFFGMAVAMWEVRRLMARQIVQDKASGALYMKQEGAGKLAGNVGLTIAGGILLSIPGFLTAIVGILLLLPPTRALTRKLMGFSFMRGVERMGMRVYEASPIPDAQHNSYGTFGSGGYEVIDEEEIHRWSESVNPEDFGRPQDPGSSKGTAQ